MLAYQHTVEKCIIHFVALKVIVEIPTLYAGTIQDDKMYQRVFKNQTTLIVTNKGAQMWGSRNALSKIERIVYKFHRSIYVSVLFYFSPFLVPLIQKDIEPGNFSKKDL
jgi:hypothetical protein